MQKKCVKFSWQEGIDIVSNGTENHMFLVDLIEKQITGKGCR